MLLDSACKWLGWPDQELILNPKGEGAAACANLVKQKIGDPLRRLNSNLVVNTGILTPDPFGGGTASPLAIICEFPNGASPKALDEAHRLAWCFSRSAILVTLEPHQLMAWSCYQDPKQPDESKRVETLSDADSSRQRQIRELLHWVSLVTGDFHRRRPKAFPAEGRADRLLLKNLRHVRKSLIQANLDRDVCHDLLARVIFTQFLFHRKDNSGNPYFSKTLLTKLSEGTLKSVHDEFGTILQDKEETYALFRWLDSRFNGDLFPGKENQSEDDREAAWLVEKNTVGPEHLKMLADLVSGTIDTKDRQLLLWPQYSFDTVPLEFISSVYEEFLNEDRDNKKAYYTPSHLVDYVLDAVLPWDGEDWNLKILDPSCGSGIFLVKAFQRLVHRWKRHHQRDPLVSDLKPILANNLLGVDKDRDAVRVACFSLYLAMADAIDPKHYVTREKVFPRLRGTRLIPSDFFDESTLGIRTVEDAASLDLVIGNAPWGDGTTQETSDLADRESSSPLPKRKSAGSSTKAEKWAAHSDHSWPIANHDIGPLFIAKSLELVNHKGRVAMIQPAPPWLYQRAKPAEALRKKLFSEFTVDEITNLSAVRRELFSDVIGPACIIVVGRVKPEPTTPLFYFTPKPIRTSEFVTSLCVEPQDVSRITHAEAASDMLPWSVLALGGRRDLELIRRLQRYPNLHKLKRDGHLLTRLGVIPGDQQKALPNLKGKPYFELTQFPDEVFLTLDADKVPAWEDPRVDLKGSTDFESFKNPQLLIKQSYCAKLGRFRAALVRSSDPEWGVICKKTYLSVRDFSPHQQHNQAACLAYNSLLATYYLFLTSSRIAHYITETLTEELMTVPLPKISPDLSTITSFEQIDELARRSFALTPADWTLVEDLLKFALPDAIRKTPGAARNPTILRQTSPRDEAVMVAYGRTLSRVLKSTFGPDKPVAVTIYQEPQAEKLPVRMMTLHLDWAGRQPLTIEKITEEGLLDKLAEFHRSVLSQRTRSVMGNGIGFQRVAYFFQTQQVNKVRVRNLTIIKPDECRYWTRSQAMRDADELAVAIMKAAQRERAKR